MWKRIEPLGRRLLPVTGLFQAFALGMLWGWLPCGLVYATLAWSLTTANPGQGALLMFGFGLGTLPMLLLMGGAAEQLNRFVRSSRTRKIAGLLIISLGVYVIASAFQDGSHAHHSDNEGEFERGIASQFNNEKMTGMQIASAVTYINIVGDKT